MTRTNSINFLAIASAAAAIAGFALVTQAGSASAKNVLTCKGDNIRSVIECCETIVRHKGEPFWMVQSGRNCGTAAVCKATGGGKPPLTTAYVPPKPKKKCYMQTAERDNPGRYPNVPEIKIKEPRGPNSIHDGPY